jgi:nitronate monooxygenase
VRILAVVSFLASEFPVIQAPMAGVQGSALAVAVSNAGGLGSLPCALLTPLEIRREIAAIKAQTQGPFNVNFFCHATPVQDDRRDREWRALLAPYYAEFGVDPDTIPSGAGRAPFDDESVRIIEDLRPPIVSFHFGLPGSDLLARVRATGAKILSSATTVDEAQWLELQGVDAIIAQGNEAGGHRGMFLTRDVTTQAGTFALVPQVVRAVNVPVIAAGGIADASGVSAALALGAAAVQVGTAYLCCSEATTSAVHRAALASDAARHTALTNIFTGRPARAIVNRVMRELGPMNVTAPEFPLAVPAMLPLRGRAEQQGSGDFSPMWAGQNVAVKAVAAGVLTRELSR